MDAAKSGTSCLTASRWSFCPLQHRKLKDHLRQHCMQTSRISKALLASSRDRARVVIQPSRWVSAVTSRRVRALTFNLQRGYTVISSGLRVWRGAGVPPHWQTLAVVHAEDVATRGRVPHALRKRCVLLKACSRPPTSLPLLLIYLVLLLTYVDMLLIYRHHHHVCVP